MGQSEKVLEVRVVAVLLRDLDEVTLHPRHEREAAVRDVPEDRASRVLLPAHARAGRVSLSM